MPRRWTPELRLQSDHPIAGVLGLLCDRVVNGRCSAPMIHAKVCAGHLHSHQMNRKTSVALPVRKTAPGCSLCIRRYFVPKGFNACIYIRCYYFPLYNIFFAAGNYSFLPFFFSSSQGQYQRTQSHGTLHNLIGSTSTLDWGHICTLRAAAAASVYLATGNKPTEVNTIK